MLIGNLLIVTKSKNKTTDQTKKQVAQQPGLGCCSNREDF